MHSFPITLPAAAVRASARKWSCDLIGLASGLLPVLDIASVLFGAYLSAAFYTAWLAPPDLPFGGWSAQELTGLAATAVLAAFCLYDPQFGTRASRGQTRAMLRRYAVGFLLFVVAALVIAFASHVLNSLPLAWLTLCFGASLLLTSLARLLLARTIRRLEHQGVLTEVIAVVGAGPLADRLIRHLRQTRGERVTILGVFDDAPHGSDPPFARPTGSVADLIALGTTRPIDWILLTLPCTVEDPLDGLVQRLKSLAAPIGLCPPNFGLTLPAHTIDYVGDGLPVTLLADRPIRRWNAVARSMGLFLPDWLHALAARRGARVVVALDDYDTGTFADVAARFDPNRYDYVVTPNADHLIRLHEDASFRALYATAAYVLLDSRFMANLVRITRGLRLPVCTGSDLTAKLFADVISPDDPLILVGGSAAQAGHLVHRYGLRQLAHFNPPMGFIRNPDAVEHVLGFIEANSPFRFCLLALGSPQQEIIAQRLKTRGIACGLALCVGGSINFLTGGERRAPRWLQRSGLEWTFRLAQSPGRMAARYLLRGPRVFGLLRQTEIVLRPSRSSPTTVSAAVQTGDHADGDNPRHVCTGSRSRTLRIPVTSAAKPGGIYLRHPVGRTDCLREQQRIVPRAT